ncbi:MAG: sigma-54-dependent Fis family transcriptional regulator [Bacteroidetes bacterium]|nr:MAG: sigma-54-dependent Fis family transcriptional regulator [Bacteroidota bacterium]
MRTIKQRYGIIGRSEALDRALDTALRVASTDLSVLITGESGVGKEVFSRIIHDNSPRKHEGFIAINCGAIPEGTINSELFGHEKGAFTGAVSERKGYFETYNGGTIFLDEIGEMPLNTQTFLLRVLESGEFMRVGSNKVLHTDVRIIAATNVNLLEKIKAGKFREDLYYRLNTVPIHLPPLRERREDIYLLFRKFAVDFADRYRTEPIQLDERGRQLLENYNWPGNIRELKNVAEQLSILAEHRTISYEELIQLMPQLQQRHLPSTPDKEEPGSIPERDLLYKLLFDMKNDLNDLKSLVFELINTNNLQMPTAQQLDNALPSRASVSSLVRQANQTNAAGPAKDYDPPGSVKAYPPFENKEINYEEGPIILNRKQVQRYDESEIVEENLSLEDNERELISKALKKHDGHRREAALDLGISERTLYRKIEKYGL